MARGELVPVLPECGVEPVYRSDPFISTLMKVDQFMLPLDGSRSQTRSDNGFAAARDA